MKLNKSGRQNLKRKIPGRRQSLQSRILTYFRLKVGNLWQLRILTEAKGTIISVSALPHCGRPGVESVYCCQGDQSLNLHSVDKETRAWISVWCCQGDESLNLCGVGQEIRAWICVALARRSELESVWRWPGNQSLNLCGVVKESAVRTSTDQLSGQ